MYLVFDTETTGLPKSFGSPMEDVNNWPRITQLAFMLVDELGNELESFCELIKPEGWEIPKEKFFIDNNMSTERCQDEGIELFGALRTLQDCTKKAKYKVAHNIAFDKNIVGAELIRKEISDQMFKFKPEICTMRETTSACGIKKSHGRGNKWPKLIELHEYLFKESFDGAHDALEDVRATKRCLIESINRGIIKLR
jgi:DNA polymerase III epsilon subunit-like protein